MRRNIDIVRQVLMKASQTDAFDPKNELEAWHTVLLIDLDYLAGWYIEEKDRQLGYIEVMGLTNKGRALLNAVRSEVVWIRTKLELGATLDRTPLEKVRMMAEEMAGQN